MPLRGVGNRLLQALHQALSSFRSYRTRLEVHIQDDERIRDEAERRPIQRGEGADEEPCANDPDERDGNLTDDQRASHRKPGSCAGRAPRRADPASRSPGCAGSRRRAHPAGQASGCRGHEDLHARPRPRPSTLAAAVVVVGLVLSVSALIPAAAVRRIAPASVMRDE